MKIEEIEISIVVPVYNEEENINIFVTELNKVIKELNVSYELIFVLDPSSDNTENKIIENIQKNKNIKLITLSRKFGQPLATIAGIEHSSGNYCVIIDVDLQDPPNVIKEMYEKIKKDNIDVVYAVRRKRDGETLIKKITANVGYRLINKLSDIDIPKNTGDFRIISKRIINELKKFDEKEAFLRGLVSYIGFKQEKIYFLVPGVKVTASIQIGERTLANYLLSPFIGSLGQSFQER